MTILRSLATEHPHISLTDRHTAALLVGLGGGDAARWRDAVARSGVRRRSAAAPPARLARLGGIGERNALYARLAPALAERVARAALACAGVAAQEIAALLVASSTGHLVPTLDCHLAARLAVPPTALRLALNDLGCVGALRALATAADLLRDRPGIALIVAVELSSLWLPAGEPGLADLDATMVFGDGAGAAVLDASAAAGGPQLVASSSTLWPASLTARGAVQTGAGLRHVASPRLSRALVANLRCTVAEFLRGQDLGLADLSFALVNPSQLALVEAVASLLALDATAAAVSRATWEQHGNTLAVGPLHLLRRLAEGTPPAEGDLGLVLAIGPGLTCEMALLRWHPLPVAHREGENPEDAGAVQRRKISRPAQGM